MNFLVRNGMLLSLAAIMTFNFFMMPLLTKSIYPLVTMFHLDLSILSLLSTTMFGNYLKKRLYAVNKAAYKEVSKNYDQAVKLWCDNIENAICENPNSAKFYGFAENKLKSHACIPPLKSNDDTLAEIDVEKANLLNSTFQKVFWIDDGQSLSLNCSVVPENWIRDIDISSEDIIQAIHLIPDKLSRSPDGIPAYFWKRIFFSILNILWLLFSLCLTLLIQWKSAIWLLLHPFMKKALGIIQVTTVQFLSPES